MELEKALALAGMQGLITKNGVEWFHPDWPECPYLIIDDRTVYHIELDVYLPKELFYKAPPEIAIETEELLKKESASKIVGLFLFHIIPQIIQTNRKESIKLRRSRRIGHIYLNNKTDAFCLLCTGHFRAVISSPVISENSDYYYQKAALTGYGFRDADEACDVFYSPIYTEITKRAINLLPSLNHQYYIYFKKDIFIEYTFHNINPRCVLNEAEYRRINSTIGFLNFMLDEY
ncbi:hypothetical protein RHH25_10085 [Thermosynechococcus sp. PP42]|uniref:hypothetical protein n=1 Tax=Thermosynechococcus sp. PP42 TaxID=3074083 RepID=UPI002856DA50|nr:hypothetical protein [Thermosynechococcus sp. PP42]MDR5639742.1 hypothetical protein [Thermosynechococcus sp. PP42]